MKHVLLDTSFIISCLKKKIDFFDYLSDEGYGIIIPKQVIGELDKLKQESALRILSNNKFREINLSGKTVDNSIINYAKENPELIVATLDAGLKKKIKNRKMVIRGEKRLEVV